MRANKKPTQARDPLLTKIEQDICLGRYIRYGDMFDFVRHMEQVEETLESLVDDGEAERAVGLYEAFLAGKTECNLSFAEKARARWQRQVGEPEAQPSQ